MVKRTGIQTVWIDHLKDQAARDKFKELISAQLNDSVFMKFKSIVNQKLLDLEDKEVSEETYKDKDWSHLMAHRNGYKQALIEVLTLMTTKD